MRSLKKYLILMSLLIPLLIGSIYLLPAEEVEAGVMIPPRTTQWLSSEGTSQRQVKSFDLPADFRSLGAVSVDTGRIESYSVDYLNRKLNVVLDGGTRTTDVYRYTNPSGIIQGSDSCGGWTCYGTAYVELRKSSIYGKIEYAEKKTRFAGGQWGYQPTPWEQISWSPAYNDSGEYSDYYTFNLGPIPSNRGERIDYQFRYYTGKELDYKKYNYTVKLDYVSEVHSWAKHNVVQGTKKGPIEVSRVSGGWGWRTVYPGVDVDPVTGKITMTGQPYESSAPGQAHYYQISTNSYAMRYMERNSCTNWEGCYTEDLYTVTYRVGDVPAQVKGDRVGTAFSGYRYEYPDNGIYYRDNFWYVYEGQGGIVLSDLNSGNVTVSKKKGQNTFTLYGNAMNYSSKSITIKANLGGVIKETTVAGGSSKKPWSLTWSEKELPGGTYNVNIYTYDGDYEFAYLYNGTVRVDKRELYVWEKYTVKRDYGYTEIGKYIISQNPNRRTVWQYLDINLSTGVPSVRGEIVDMSTAPCTWTSNQWCSGSKGGYYIENGKAYYQELWGQVENGYFRQGLSEYTVAIGRSQSAPMVPSKDQLVDPMVVDFQNTYPDDGVHSDGYWYVLKGKYAEEPVLTLDSQGTVYVSEVAGRRVFNITGRVEDLGSNPVVVKATVAGKEKSIAVTGTSAGNPKQFTLSWDVLSDGIPEGTYQGVEVVASNGIGSKKAVSPAIIVVDKTKPTFSLVTIRSNNMDSKYAKAGDQVVLEFVTSEVLGKIPQVTIQGRVATLSSNTGNRYVFSSTLTRNDLGGNISFNVSVEDLAGNSNSTNKTTDGSSVEFYPLEPVATSVKMYSTNTNPQYAKVGDTVAVEIELNQKWKNTPSFKIAGRNAAVSKISDKVIKGTTVMVETDNEGTVPFVVENIIDAAGNMGRITSSGTDGKRVVFDKTPPTFSTVSISESSGNVNLYMVSNEKLKNTPKVKISGESVNTVTSNNLVFESSYKLKGSEPQGPIPFTVIEYEDLAGNTGTLISETTDGSSVVIGEPSVELSKVRIYSTNSNNSSQASEGDIVYVEFESPKELVASEIQAEIGSGIAEVENVSGNVWRVSKRMWEGDPAGVVKFSISGLVYKGSETKSSVSNTTDGSSVVFNKTEISAESVSIKSSNSDPTRAKVGDTITVEFTASKPLAGDPLVMISGQKAYYDSSSGNTYRYSYTLTENDPEGEVSVNIGGLNDLSGATGDFVESTTDGSRVVFDITPPKVEDVMISGGKYEGETLTLTFKESERLKRVPSVSIGGSTVQVESLGSGKYRASKRITADMSGKVEFYISDIEDLSGNVGTPVSNLSGGETPSIEGGGVLMIAVSGVEEGKSYSEVVTPTFSASSALSQDVLVSATLTGKDWPSGKPIKTIGDHVLKITARDNLGNLEEMTVRFKVTR